MIREEADCRDKRKEQFAICK